MELSKWLVLFKRTASRYYMNGSMCLYFVHKQMYDCDRVDLKKFQNITCITYVGETFLWEMFDVLKSGGRKALLLQIKARPICACSRRCRNRWAFAYVMCVCVQEEHPWDKCGCLLNHSSHKYAFHLHIIRTQKAIMSLSSRKKEWEQ